MTTTHDEASRPTPWTLEIAHFLTRRRAQPELLLATEFGIAVLGGALLAASGVAPAWARAILLLLGAACVQGRRLTAALERLVARESGRAIETNSIWTGLTDRVADLILFVGAGYAAFGLGWDAGPALGWLVGVLALLTEYAREAGRRIGGLAGASGAVATRRRMNALTAVCVVAALEPAWGGHGLVMMLGLIAIAIVSIYGLLNRLRRTEEGPSAAA